MSDSEIDRNQNQGDENPSLEEIKYTTFKDALRWLFGFFFLMSGIGVMFLDTKIPEDYREQLNPTKHHDTVIVYQLRDTVLMPVPSDEEVTPPTNDAYFDLSNESDKKPEPVKPAKEDPPPIVPTPASKSRYSLAGTYTNTLTKNLAGKSVTWKITQNGNAISAEVFKANGKKKGDATGYISGDTLIITSYYTSLAQSVAYLLIFDNGNTLDGELVENATFSNWRIKLIKQPAD